jgi:hypothetical protein
VSLNGIVENGGKVGKVESSQRAESNTVSLKSDLKVLGS